MSIFDRVRRIAKANINWLLDMAEPAENELNNKIKELEDTILEGRESAASYGATFRRLENELEALKTQLLGLTQKAQIALKGGDEAAARAVLTEKVKLAERIAQMQPGVEKGRKSYEMLRANIIKLQEQLKTAKLKHQDLVARKRAADAQKAFDEKFDKATSLSPDGVSFDRLEEDVLQSEAQVEINSEIRGDTLSDFELAEHSRQMQVDAELEALRAEIEA
jgi:phage shock protein A